MTFFQENYQRRSATKLFHSLNFSNFFFQIPSSVPGTTAVVAAKEKIFTLSSGFILITKGNRFVVRYGKKF